MQLEQGSLMSEAGAPTGVTPDLLRNARLITDPGERSLALERIAIGAIFSNQLILAHQTLEEAISATAKVTVPLVRDQRLIAIVTAISELTEGLLREGKKKTGPRLDNTLPLAALPDRLDAAGVIRLARLEWKRGSYLASIIGNPTYRNEELYRVAESAASGSATIANSYVLRTETEPPRKNPGATIPDQSDSAKFEKLADEILVDAFEDAKKIDRLIWKYAAMVRIAVLAADSEQYARGVDLARGIENSESRAQAMIVLAELQSRRDKFVSFDEPPSGFTFPPELTGRVYFDPDRRRLVLRGYLSRSELDQIIQKSKEKIDALVKETERPEVRLSLEQFLPKLRPALEKLFRLSADDQEAATPIFELAATAVASIQQRGLRGVLTGFVVDSLIASGRFDDARASVVIFPEESERFVALGQIAEAQGRLGAAESARKWIASSETPEAYRPALYRRVTAGVLWSVEQNRSAETSRELERGGVPLP
jgi:hypothetical protein